MDSPAGNMCDGPQQSSARSPHCRCYHKHHKLVKTESRPKIKLQALVYDILPSTTAVFSYAIGSRKLPANEQFFVGAQTVVSLLQTTHIKQGVSFIAATKFTPAKIKPQSFESRRNSFFFLPGVDASHVYVRALALGCFYSHISTRTFRRALREPMWPSGKAVGW